MVKRKSRRNSKNYRKTKRVSRKMRTNKRINRKSNKRMKRRTNQRINGRSNKRMKRRTNQRINGKSNKRMKKRTNKRIRRKSMNNNLKKRNNTGGGEPMMIELNVEESAHQALRFYLEKKDVDEFSNLRRELLHPIHVDEEKLKGRLEEKEINPEGIYKTTRISAPAPAPTSTPSPLVQRRISRTRPSAAPPGAGTPTFPVESWEVADGYKPDPESKFDTAVGIKATNFFKFVISTPDGRETNRANLVQLCYDTGLFTEDFLSQHFVLGSEKSRSGLVISNPGFNPGQVEMSFDKYISQISDYYQTAIDSTLGLAQNLLRSFIDFMIKVKRYLDDKHRKKETISIPVDYDKLFEIRKEFPFLSESDDFSRAARIPEILDHMCANIIERKEAEAEQEQDQEEEKAAAEEAAAEEAAADRAESQRKKRMGKQLEMKQLEMNQRTTLTKESKRKRIEAAEAAAASAAEQERLKAEAEAEEAERAAEQVRQAKSGILEKEKREVLIPLLKREIRSLIPPTEEQVNQQIQTYKDAKEQKSAIEAEESSLGDSISRKRKFAERLEAQTQIMEIEKIKSNMLARAYIQNVLYGKAMEEYLEVQLELKAENVEDMSQEEATALVEQADRLDKQLEEAKQSEDLEATSRLTAELEMLSPKRKFATALIQKAVIEEKINLLGEGLYTTEQIEEEKRNMTPGGDWYDDYGNLIIARPMPAQKSDVLLNRLQPPDQHVYEIKLKRLVSGLYHFNAKTPIQVKLGENHKNTHSSINYFKQNVAYAFTADAYFSTEGLEEYSPEEKIVALQSRFYRGLPLCHHHQVEALFHLGDSYDKGKRVRDSARHIYYWIALQNATRLCNSRSDWADGEWTGEVPTLGLTADPGTNILPLLKNPPPNTPYEDNLPISHGAISDVPEEFFHLAYRPVPRKKQFELIRMLRTYLSDDNDLEYKLYLSVNVVNKEEFFQALLNLCLVPENKYRNRYFEDRIRLGKEVDSTSLDLKLLMREMKPVDYRDGIVLKNLLVPDEDGNQPTLSSIEGKMKVFGVLPSEFTGSPIFSPYCFLVQESNGYVPQPVVDIGSHKEYMDYGSVFTPVFLSAFAALKEK